MAYMSSASIDSKYKYEKLSEATTFKKREFSVSRENMALANNKTVMLSHLALMLSLILIISIAESRFNCKFF